MNHTVFQKQHLIWKSLNHQIHRYRLLGEAGRRYKQHGTMQLNTYRHAAAASIASTTTTETPLKSSTPMLDELTTRNARMTNIAHDIWCRVLQPGDTVVDATSGNGHDTLFLAQAVGSSGKVFAFDLQASAIAATQSRINAGFPDESMRPEMQYHQACHSTLQERIGSHIAKLVAFNLGYLPGSDDKENTATSESSTISALEASFEVLHPGGLVSILAYIGHGAAALEEYAAVEKTMAELPTHYWITSQIKLLNRPTAPVLFLAWKRDVKKVDEREEEDEEEPSVAAFMSQIS